MSSTLDSFWAIALLRHSPETVTCHGTEYGERSLSRRIQKAGRRYVFELGAALALYAVVLFTAKWLANDALEGPLLTALALAPLAPVALMVAAFLRYYFKIDERERRISSDAAAITLVVGIMVALTLGFLHSFAVFHFEWDMLWFGPFLIGLWGVVRWIARRSR